MTVRFARDASPETHPTPKRTRSWFASMRVQRRLRCKGRARLPSANQERSTSDSTRTRSGRLSRALTERRFVAGRSRAFPSLLIRSKGIRPRLSPRRGSRAHDSTQSPSSHLESYAPRAARSSVPTPRRWPRLRVEPSPARAALAAERTTREGECLVSSSRLGTRALVRCCTARVESLFMKVRIGGGAPRAWAARAGSGKCELTRARGDLGAGSLSLPLRDLPLSSLRLLPPESSLKSSLFQVSESLSLRPSTPSRRASDTAHTPRRPRARAHAHAPMCTPRDPLGPRTLARRSRAHAQALALLPDPCPRHARRARDRTRALRDAPRETSEARRGDATMRTAKPPRPRCEVTLERSTASRGFPSHRSPRRPCSTPKHACTLP